MRLYTSNKYPLGHCDNKYQRIDHSLGLNLRSSASLIRIRGNLSDYKILSWCFQGKTTRVPKPVYATVLTVKVSEFARFWYRHPTNFDKPKPLQRQSSIFSYYEARIYRKLLPLEIHISSRNYGQVRQSTSKKRFMFGGSKIKGHRHFVRS